MPEQGYPLLFLDATDVHAGREILLDKGVNDDDRDDRGDDHREARGIGAINAIDEGDAEFRGFVGGCRDLPLDDDLQRPVEGIRDDWLVPVVAVPAGDAIEE